jgi:hypothetical protein
MRKLLTSLTLGALLASGLQVITTPALASDSEVSNMLAKERATESIIFELAEETDPRDTPAGGLGFVIEPLGSNTYISKLPWWATMSTVLSQMLNDERVNYAEPDYLLTHQSTPLPDDVDLGSMWHLGSGPGVNVQEAWGEESGGSDQVYVAVIDSGIDINHPDLAQNMWVNTAEASGELGVDEDLNGFQDDVYGYDFVLGRGIDGSAVSIGEHGTAVAGAIAAVGNNGQGAAGVAWQTKLISVRAFDDTSGSMANVIRALNYVTSLRTQAGLNIVATNNSYSSPIYSRALEAAVNRGGNAGILFIAAAGNEGKDLDSQNSFPGILNCQSPVRDFDCVVTVASIGPQGQLSSFSNFGKERVDIAAPGEAILTTQVNSSYYPSSGTSFSAPLVAGAIALCVSSNPGISAAESKAALLATSHKSENLEGRVASGGSLDVSSFVRACKESKQEALSGNPTQFRATATYTDRVRLEWVDSSVGEFGYSIRYGQGPAGCTVANSKHLAHIGPGLRGFEVENLEEAEFYCFSIVSTRDSASSQRLNSNLSITFTSNLPYISGKVFMSDGVAPVRNARVSWSATASAAVWGYTDSEGSYMLQASPGVQGVLAVEGPRSYRSTEVLTTPRLPLGFRLNGALTLSQDTIVNLTLPEFNTISVSVKDGPADSGIAGAILTARSVNGEAVRCAISERDWSPSPMLSPIGSSFCSYRLPSVGLSNTFSITDESGNYSFEVLDAFLQAGTNATFPILITGTDSTNNQRTGQARVNTDVPSNIAVELKDPRVLTGQVKNFGGLTTIAGARVSVGSQCTGTAVASTSTLSDGTYSLTVPEIDNLIMVVQFPNHPNLPNSLRLCGRLPVSVSGIVDFTLPEVNRIKLIVKDDLTQSTLARSRVELAHPRREQLGCMLSANDYAPSPRLKYESLRTCLYSASTQLTNASGEVEFWVVDGFYQNGRSDFQVSLTAQHSSDSNRAGRISIETGQNSESEVFIGGSPLVTGRVTLDDKTTPVQNVEVRFTTSAFTAVTRTNSLGEYSLKVPLGVSGRLEIVNSSNLNSAYPTGEATTPALPAGLNLGGNLTATGNVTIDLALPKLRTVNLTVKDIHTGDPVPKADVYLSLISGDPFQCQVSSSDYSPSELLTYPTRTCTYRPGGNQHQGLPTITDESGKISIVLIDGWYQSANDAKVRVRVQHPLDGARVGEVIIPTNRNHDLEIEIAGTPSRPKQPQVSASSEVALITWEEPWDGGEFIDFYQVYVALDAQGPYELVSSGSCLGQVDPALRSCTVSNLTPGVTYYFAIVAKNVVGYSTMSLASAVTPRVTVQDLVETPDPSIVGDPKVGSLLTVEPGVWDEGVELTYTWLVGGEQVTGEHGINYLVRASDLGQRIGVMVSGSKPFHHSSSRSSHTKSIVGPGQLTLTPTPSIQGSAIVGSSLKVLPGSWDNGVNLRIQWLRDNRAIKGATSRSYFLKRTDANHRITVRVIGSLTGYTAATTTSEPSSSVLRVFTRASRAKVIGTAKVGSTLRAKVAAWSPRAKLSYQWHRNGAPIPGARKASYRLSNRDKSARISVKVTGSALGFAPRTVEARLGSKVR